MKAAKLCVNSTDGLQLHGWMVTELHLTGGELFAFALVHQFSQSRAGLYRGNRSYLASWLGCSEKTAHRYLLALEQKGLIVAERGNREGKDFCYYRVSEGGTKLPPEGGQKRPPRGDKNDQRGGTKLPPDNYRIDNNSLNIIPPTPQAVADYVRQMVKDPEGFALYYLTSMAANEWMRGKGKDRKPVTNWKNNVLQWVKYHKNEDFSYLKPVTSKTSTILSASDFNKMLNI